MIELSSGELDADGRAKERVMLERLLANAKAFFQNPENRKAFEAWKQNKEEQTYGTTNYIDS